MTTMTQVGPVTTTLETPRATGRALNVTLWSVQILMAVFFGFAGVNKLLGLQPEMVENFARLGLGLWFRHLVGVLELGGAIALVIPRVSGLGAIWLGGVMAGAIVTHLTVQPPAYYAVFPAVLLVVFALVAWGRWSRTRPLLARLFSRPGT